MGLFDKTEKRDQIVVNLTQNLEFSKSHHVGVYDDHSEPVGSENPRTRVEWMPKDSIENREAQRSCRTPVRRDRIVRFPPGTLAPRGVWWLLPDNANELPEQARDHKHLGPFFQQWYKHKALIKALKFKARTEQDVMEKLRITENPSELNDRVKRVFNQYIKDAEKLQQVRRGENDADVF